MKKKEFIKSLEPRFRQPAGLVLNKYFPSNKGRVRYAYSKAKNEIAQIVFSGGLGQFIEMDFEMIRDLNDLGISIWWLERFGEGGSQRQFSDLQKPPTFSASEYAIDLIEFLEIIKSNIDKKKPLIFMGSCYGCLIGIHSCLINDSIWDKLILVSPMFGLIWSQGKEVEWVEQHSEVIENIYVGKARKWSWKLANKLLLNEKTTHDKKRARLIYIWRKQFPRLRLGGFTYPSVTAFSKSVIELLEDQKLEKIRTRIIIVSAENDFVNDNKRHEIIVNRLPNSDRYLIKDSYHGIWRESDKYRNQLINIVKSEVLLNQSLETS